MTLLLAPEIDLPATITIDAWGMAACTECGTDIYTLDTITLDTADQAWTDHLSDPDTPRTCGT